MTTVWRLLIEDPDVTLAWMREKGRIAIGWGEIGDLKKLETMDAIADAIRERNKTHPDHVGKPSANVQHGASSLFDFVYEMRKGHFVIISDGSRRREVWEVEGEYQHEPPGDSPRNYQHQRAARPIERNPDDLWQQAGGRLADGQVNFRTLGRLPELVE